MISLLLFEIKNVRNMFILWLNQANHRFTTKMQRRIYGHSVDAVIRPLDEEKAVQAAADLTGELFVFSVLAFPAFIVCVIWIWKIKHIHGRKSLLYVCFVFVYASYTWMSLSCMLVYWDYGDTSWLVLIPLVTTCDVSTL
jgi:hypothetical protein